MTLTKILDEGDFLGIQYIDNKYKSIRNTSIKKLGYNSIEGEIILIKDREESITFNYLEVEDPDNLGNAFSSLTELWDYILNIIGISTQIIKYGYLYNWYLSSDSNITATGWVVPTDANWTTLTNYLGGLSVAGGKLKETGLTYWLTPNTGATNEVSFNTRGGGTRTDSGNFILLNQYGRFWTNTQFSGTLAYFRFMTNDSAAVTSNNNLNKGTGNSVRLLKSSTTLSHGETSTYTGNDGKVYPTICVGTQEWLSVNLAETKFRNGTDLTKVTDGTAWDNLTTDGYCAFDNDESNVII